MHVNTSAHWQTETKYGDSACQKASYLAGYGNFFPVFGSVLLAGIESILLQSAALGGNHDLCVETVRLEQSIRLLLAGL